MLRQLSGFEYRHISKIKKATQGKEWPTQKIYFVQCAVVHPFSLIAVYCKEVDSRKVKDLEDTVRLKNKQIHQLLEDVDQVEQDNTSKIDLITIKP